MLNKVFPLFSEKSITACLWQLCEHNAKIRSSITAHIAHLHARPEATSNVRLVSNIILDISNRVHLTYNVFPSSNVPVFFPLKIWTQIQCFCLHLYIWFILQSSAHFKNSIFILLWSGCHPLHPSPLHFTSGMHLISSTQNTNTQCQLPS